jgi:hypothetical protein
LVPHIVKARVRHVDRGSLAFTVAYWWAATGAGLDDHDSLRSLIRAVRWDSDPDDERVLLQLLMAWPTVRGGKVLVALNEARQHPVTLVGPLARASENVRLIVGTAYHAQNAEPDDPITLPQERLGLALGLSHRAVGKCIAMAREYGLLERCGTYSYTRGRAQEYRFNFDAISYRKPRDTSRDRRARAL